MAKLIGGVLQHIHGLQETLDDVHDAAEISHVRLDTTMSRGNKVAISPGSTAPIEASEVLVLAPMLARSRVLQ